MTEERPPDDGIVHAEETFGIGNEFTGAEVRKVWTKQGERLEIVVPRTGYRILLDAMQLEIIAKQHPERFSELFAVSLGAADTRAADTRDADTRDADTRDDDQEAGQP